MAAKSWKQIALAQMLLLSMLNGTTTTWARPVASSAAAAKQQGLNLSSRSTAFSASSQQLQGGQSTINIGGANMIVRVGANLTAGEFIALNQVVNSGRQSLLLDGAGRAVGGMFSLQDLRQNSFSFLSIPHNVTAIDDFSKGGALNLPGRLINNGNFYAVSTNQAVDTAYISASSIFNGTNALISSILPTGGLAGVSNAVANLHLSLSALQDIVNQGTISSSGHLTLVASGSIVNSLPAGASGSVPTLQAMGNVNLQTANLVNAGLIASMSGNINIAQQVLADVTVDNRGGVMQALNGQINVRDLSIGSAAFNTTLNKGDWLSQELNIYSGQGTVNIDVGQLSGVLNVSAEQLHVSADTEKLRLGNICLSGDPTFFDTGSIELTSAMNLTTNGAHLAIIAGGDITVDPGETQDIHIDTSGASGGGDILLVSGAQFTTSNNSASNLAGDSSGIVVTITGASASGGNIDLNGTNGNGVTTINSSPTGADADGGYITVVAYKGYISVPANITSGGTGSGNNGTVKIIAGATTGILIAGILDSHIAIALGNIDTTGGSGASGGAIKMTTATPLIASFEQLPDVGTFYTPVSSLDVKNGAVQGQFAFSAHALADDVTVSDNSTTPFYENNASTVDGGTHGLSTIDLQPMSITFGALTSTGSLGTIIHAGRAIQANGTLTYVDHGFRNSDTEVRLEAPTVQIDGTSVPNAQLFVLTGDGGFVANQNISAGQINLDTTAGPNDSGNISYYSMQTTGITLGSDTEDFLRIILGGTISSSHVGGSPICCDSISIIQTKGSLGSENNPLVTSAQSRLSVSADQGSVYVLNVGGTVHLSHTSHASIDSNAVLSVDNQSGDLILGTPIYDVGILNNSDPDNFAQSTVQLSVHGNGNILTASDLVNENFIASGHIILSAENGNIGSVARVDVPAEQIASRLGSINIVNGSTLDVITQKSAYITVVNPALLGGSIINPQITVFEFPDTQTSIRTVQIGAGGTFDYVSLSAHDVRITSDATHHVSVSANSTFNVVSPGTLQVSGPITFAGTFSSTDGAHVTLTAQGDLTVNNVASGAINIAGSHTTVALQSTAGKVVIGADVNMQDGGAFNVMASSQIQVNAASLTAGTMQFTANGGANSFIFVDGTSSVTAVGNAGNGGNGSLTFTTSEMFNVGQIWSKGANGTITIQDAGNDLTITSTESGPTHPQSFTALGGTAISANSPDRIIFSGISAVHPTFIGPVQISDSNALITISSTVTIVDNNGITFTTNELANYGQINSTGSAFVQSGSGLLMSGVGGTFNSSTGTVIQTISQGITFQGNHFFDGPVSIQAFGTNGEVTINPGVNISVFIDSSSSTKIDERLAVFAPSGKDLIVDSGTTVGTLTSAGGVQLSVDGGHQLTFQHGTQTLNGPAVISAPKLSGAGTVAFNDKVVYTKTATVNSLSVTNKTNLLKQTSTQAAAVFSTTGTGSSAAGAPLQIETTKLTNSGLVAVTDSSITSLDLTNPLTVGLLKGLQTAGILGGSLTVATTGIHVGQAIGGTIIFNKSITLNVSAMDIPVNVTATFQDFSASNPITVNLAANSTTQHVELDGTEQFLKVSLPASSGFITVNSTITPAPGSPPTLFTLGGKLTTDGSISISVPGYMSINGPITASNGSVTLTTTAGSGYITIANNITANASTGRVFLTTDSSGRINQNQSGSLITAGLLSITTGGGSAGAPTQPLKTSVVSIAAAPNNGSIYINNARAVTLGALGSINVGFGTFYLSNADAITVNSAVIGPNISLITTAKAGIVLNASVGQTGGLVTLNSFTTITEANTVFLPQVIGHVITLRAKGNIGQSATPMEIDSDGTTCLIASTSTSASAMIESDGKLTLIQPFTGGSLSLSTTGDLVTGAGIVATSVFLNANNGNLLVNAGIAAASASLTANNGDLVVNAGIAAANVFLQALNGGSVIMNSSVGKALATVQISADNDIKQTGTGAIVAGTLMLGSNNGSVGDGNTSTINTQATKTITVLAHTGIHIANNGATILGLVTADSGAVEVDSNNKITTIATSVAFPEEVSGSLGTILKNTGANGGIVIGSLVGTNDNSSGTVLTATGTGTITTVTTKVGAGSVTGIVYGERISLNTVTGNIGSSAAALNTAGSIISANTAITSGTASAYINNIGGGGVNVDSSAVRGAYSFTNNGSITVIGSISTNGLNTASTAGLTLLETGTTAGTISVMSNLTAIGGNILIRNSNVAGNIDIGSGIHVTASSTATTGGGVKIVVGAVPSTPTAGTPPTGLTPTTASGGKVYFSTTGITANIVQGIDVTATGRTVIFANGGTNASQITLGDNSAIHAQVNVQGSGSGGTGTGTSGGSQNLSYHAEFVDDSIIDTGACDLEDDYGVNEMAGSF